MKKNNKLAMLWGLHCGDSLGATMEFGPSVKDSHLIHKNIVGGGSLGWAAGDATDDTDLMIAVLKSIKNNNFDVSNCEQNFIEWYKKDPKDVGSTTKNAILKMMNMPASEFKNISLSNGSLMRCAPLALINTSEEELVKIIKVQNEMTHNQEDALLADICFIKALRLILDGKNKNEVYNLILNWSEENFKNFYVRLKHVNSTPWNLLQTSGHVLDTLFCAFWALMRCNTFEEALILVVNRGDDADTCGAVSGALCGAYHGLDAIPERWLSVIKRKEEIETELNRVLNEQVIL